jgi:signal transduction histidine kinase
VTPVPQRHETTLYLLLQGALANVAAHSGAQNVKVTLASAGGCIRLRIEDDGRGFAVDETLRSPQQAFGLRTMRDRVELLGGTIHFESRSPSRRAAPHGTVVDVQLPLRRAEAA